jgi:hypothetical protein
LKIPELGIVLSAKEMALKPKLGWKKTPTLRIRGGGTWKVKLLHARRRGLMVARGPALVRFREIISSQSTQDIEAAFVILKQEVEQSLIPCPCLYVNKDGELIQDALESGLRI